MRKLRLLISLGVLSIPTTTMAADEQDRNPLANLDSNGDDSVSFAEFQEGDTRAFARIDSNEDGVLSIDECLTGRPGPMAGGRGNRGNRGDADGQRSEPSEEQRALMQEMMELRANEQFQEMNRDGDEFVSLAEFQEATFLRLDQDNNGALTAQELRPQRRGGPRAGGRRQGSPRGGQTGDRPPRA